MSEDEIYSRALSRTLRHKAKAQGFSISAEGWVPTTEILASSIFKGLTAAKLDELVAACAKQRFEFSPDRTHIRATQGHSVAVRLETHTQLTLETLPTEIIHGTDRASWEKIKESGLHRMGRQHVHMASSLDAKSGMRKSCSVLVYVDGPAALASGVEFLLSTNGVILSPGPIGPEFLVAKTRSGELI